MTIEPQLHVQSVAFTASATSAAITPNVRGPVLAIETPASFGQTSIKFSFCDTVDGTYLTVKNELGDDIEVVVDATTAAMYDLTNIFPLGVGKLAGSGKGFLKLVTGGSVTKTVKLYFLGA